MAPENTLFAIETGIKYKFTSVEFDVMLSKDWVPYLMHDDTLDRVTIDMKYRGKSLSELESYEADEIDVGSWYYGVESEPNREKITIPRFEEVLKVCISQNIVMNIEVKPASGYERITGEAVGAICSSYFTPDSPLMPLISSFSYDALVGVKESASSFIPRAFLIDDISQEPLWKEKLNDLEAIGLNTNHENLDEVTINEVKSQGYHMLCYTVNTIEKAEELLSLGVDSICTDRLDLFQSKL
jgi:glycerophosphoryl diester phosphodiesterase